MKHFKEKVSEENQNYRSNLRDCYASLENYCKDKYKSGNYLDLIADSTNLVETCKTEISGIIQQDYIKSSNFNFEVRPNVKNATDFLRKEILGINTDHMYNKSLERAVYEDRDISSD